ncbi:kinase-like domain-containing protein, partial [Apodospora peruviana]
THRRKLFALLALSEQVRSVKEFVDCGIHDSDLPFIMEESKSATGPFYLLYKWHDLRKSDGADSRKPISCFFSWQDSKLENFERNQWQLLAPYFELVGRGYSKVEHYNFADKIILPFIEDSSDSSTEGGFSNVWRVKIHRAHHNQCPSKNPTDNPSYAIKRLQKNDEKAFKDEVQALKRFSDKHHYHLINLLMTYHYRGQYHLVFPWADGNLLDFWKKYPHHDFPPRDWNFAQWVARQWLAVVEGLQAIHKAPTSSSSLPRSETYDPNDPRSHGRHGDMKPENILWFKSGHQYLQDPDDLGLFVISDFGLTRFHRSKTVDQVSPTHLARTPTYRPPECDVSKTISQSYDIWTLGCVLLEFAIWYLHGWEEVDKASERRAAAERQAIAEMRAAAAFADGREDVIPGDKFFELTENSVVEDDATIEKVARLKQCVKDEFKSLRQRGTTRFFHEMLDYVEDHLLRMRPDMRAKCDDIVHKFTQMHDRCLIDESYCTAEIPRPDRADTKLSEL